MDRLAIDDLAASHVGGQGASPLPSSGNDPNV